MASVASPAARTAEGQAERQAQGSEVGVGPRLVAAIIDLSLVNVTGFILLWLVRAATGMEFDTEWFLRVYIFNPLLAWAYYSYMEGTPAGSTIGKAALGLRTARTDGQAMTFGRAAKRSASKLITAVTLGLGFFLAAFTRRKQALHDLIAGTVVVRV